jgi:hypothetical protein
MVLLEDVMTAPAATWSIQGSYTFNSAAMARMDLLGSLLKMLWMSSAMAAAALQSLLLLCFFLLMMKLSGDPPAATIMPQTGFSCHKLCSF